MTTESSIDRLIDNVSDIDGDIDALLLAVVKLSGDVRRLEKRAIEQAARIIVLELEFGIKRPWPSSQD